MEYKSVVVIQDASREVNLRVFDWALDGLSLVQGDRLTLVIVLHQVISPMGYITSVDSRHMMGANQKIIEAAVAKTKDKYLKNEELVEFFKLYKSKKVEFNIEVATGSSPKAVALKIAKKLLATWVILDRKMKNDEEYFLEKLSCNISRLRRHNRIVHLRGRPGVGKGKQDNTPEIYPESIPESANSLNESDTLSTEFLPKSISFPKYNTMNREVGSSVHAFDDYITEETSPFQPEMNPMEDISKELDDKIKIYEQHQDKGQKESSHEGKSHYYITCDGSNKGSQEQKRESTKLYAKSEEPISYCGAKHFYLGSAEEYKVCDKFFRLCNSLG